MRLSLTAPRFDAAEVERMRGQVVARLTRETTSPNEIAGKRWWSTAFPTHPYGRPVNGTLETVPRIDSADLEDATWVVKTLDDLVQAFRCGVARINGHPQQDGLHLQP